MAEPPSQPDESAELPPMYALSIIDTFEYHGIVDLERASTERRRIFEAESVREILEVIDDIVNSIPMEEREHLRNLAGDRLEWIDQTLFEVRDDVRY